MVISLNLKMSLNQFTGKWGYHDLKIESSNTGMVRSRGFFTQS